MEESHTIIIKLISYCFDMSDLKVTVFDMNEERVESECVDMIVLT